MNTVKEHSPNDEFVGPRTVEFRFRFTSESDANNFADSFDDHFPEIDRAGITYHNEWLSSVIAPAVRTTTEVNRLNGMITSIARLHNGELDGLFFYD